jgi:D-lactate dehydrogenase (cytochrome)
MKRSRDSSDIAPYLSDESRWEGGHAEEVVFPGSAEEAAELLAECHRAGRPVTVSGGGTGVAAGRVPRGGVVLAAERMSRVLEPPAPASDGSGTARMRVQCGVSLADVQRIAAEHGWLYPPDPTETGCALGGTLATNASGARTFRFGPTRRWVTALRVALADGTVLDVPRGRFVARGGRFELPAAAGAHRVVPAPDWELPSTTKHQAGYFSAPDLDLIDLLIGSEGTLCVFLEAELKLLPAPADVPAGIFFFEKEQQALAFVEAARGDESHEGGAEGVRPWSLELFDGAALELIRRHGADVPERAGAAIFFEEGLDDGSLERLDACQEGWIALGEGHGALEESWVATTPAEHGSFRELRHAIPVSINETLAERRVSKLSTDTAVPRGRVAELLSSYRERLEREGLEHVIFGHIGDDHPHVNILPRDREDHARARQVFGDLCRIAVELGGTVAAEHGLGKLKAFALPLLYPPDVIERMREVRRALDPDERLGRGTLFGEGA